MMLALLVALAAHVASAGKMKNVAPQAKITATSAHRVHKGPEVLLKSWASPDDWWHSGDHDRQPTLTITLDNWYDVSHITTRGVWHEAYNYAALEVQAWTRLKNGSLGWKRVVIEDSNSGTANSWHLCRKSESIFTLMFHDWEAPEKPEKAIRTNKIRIKLWRNCGSSQHFGLSQIEVISIDGNVKTPARMVTDAAGAAGVDAVAHDTATMVAAAGAGVFAAAAIIYAVLRKTKFGAGDPAEEVLA